jgi:membrane protease YdiL (CAAX protease family)
VAFAAVAAALLGGAYAAGASLAAVALAHAAYNAGAVAVDRWGPRAARRRVEGGGAVPVAAASMAG